MPTITIPKEFVKYDKLTAISEERYEEFLRAIEERGYMKSNKKSEGERVLAIARTLPVARRLKRHKKFYEELDKSLKKTLQEIKEGKGYAFETVEEGMKFLDSRIAASPK